MEKSRTNGGVRVSQILTLCEQIHRATGERPGALYVSAATLERLCDSPTTWRRDLADAGIALKVTSKAEFGQLYLDAPEEAE